MAIEMPKRLPFSVDTWTPASDGKRYHFLTHAHKDHTQGIVAHASYPIYSTMLTRRIILHYYPQLDKSMFVDIEVGQSLIIEDQGGDFTVTAFDANHCPGAVMFLFEGNFGNILHTGDCRLTPECLQNLPDKYIGKKGKEPRCPLDCIFLDCTFGQFPSRMPSRNMAIQQVINCIWKHPDAPTVYLTCDLLGQEEILVEVSKTFGQKIYVDKTRNLECFKSLEITVPDIISQDSSRFQLLEGFPRLYERAEAMISKARANFQHEPLILRASSQWYACDDGVSDIEKQKKERFDQAVRDIHGVWHICYSIHSSRDELEWALQLLMPKWVVSTTPNCRAMELTYVKKHCSKNAWVNSETLQKLLDISQAASIIHTNTLVESLSYSNGVENIPTSSIETQSEPVVIPTGQRKRLSLSPPCKRPMVTLFGRARLGLPDSCMQHEPKELSKSSNSMENISIRKEDVSHPEEGAAEVKLDSLVETVRKADFAETECSAPDIDMSAHNLVEVERKADFAEPECPATDRDMGTQSPVAISPIRWPNSYSETLRRFYRSMNVPVPQRLPSLTELMGARKSAKQRL